MAVPQFNLAITFQHTHIYVDRDEPRQFVIDPKSSYRFVLAFLNDHLGAAAQPENGGRHFFLFYFDLLFKMARAGKTYFVTGGCSGLGA